MEDFVTFELAKKLKENGFDYPCIAHYDINKELKVVIREPIFWHSDVLSYTDAPTISQVLKWLREEKKICIETFLYNGTYSYYVKSVTQICEDDFFHQCLNEDTTDEEYDSYEEAALTGIEYCLDNLI